MIKRLAATGFLFGLTVAAAPLAPAAAADCGLAGLLSPCVTPPPSPQPAPLPVPPPPVLAVPTLPAAPATPEPVVTPAPAPPPPAPSAPVAAGRSAVPAAADRLLQLVNEARSGAGLAGLTISSRAASIAADHSMAMAERGDIYHNPAYLTAATRSSLGARALGENVAMNGSVEAAHQRLMASPGHRANILNGAFDAVGIAVVRDAGGTLFITQNFLDSAGTAPASPAPKAGAKPAAAPTAP
ncbi:MAG TPA: CAP domain-containing protein, partial [Acidimicrobiales bacterium]|nr:CAP domain-containing protein [Acidimicrobiales bacterium]